MKKFLKYALRSHSLGFAKAALRDTPTGAVTDVSYCGKPVHYRGGSSDALVIYEMLLKGRKSEYWHARLPKPEQAKVVLDIGANVGAAGGEDKVSVSVPVRKSGDFVRELGLRRVDVIRIYTEGAEKEILHGLTPEQLDSAQYIVDELHGERDFELLDWLEQRGFDIECKKSFGKPCFIFKALRVRPQA